MLNKTHIAIGFFFMLFFITKVTHIWTYIFIFAFATLLPNLDRVISFKKLRIFNKSNNSSRKRGFLHSFTFCLAITFLFAWFLPTLAFPFFLAYGTHLIADSWTTEGIKPFWPLKYSVKGKVKQGGSLETILFYSFIIADVLMLWFRLS